MENNNKRGRFLKDVLICSLGAYGGPESHLGVFIDQLVKKKKYLSEEELVELVALCSILPGPTSTQVIVSVGYKIGGPFLAFLAMLVWAMPVIIIMSALTFMYDILIKLNLSSDALRYIGPMAVGFIIVAAFRISKRVIKDRLTGTLMLFAAIVTYFFRFSFVFPLLLIVGGIVSILTSKEKDLFNKVDLKPKWKYLVIFSLFALLLPILNNLFNYKIIDLFNSFYRYGYLVFGGGQVVVPLMFTELVEIKGFITAHEFLTGYGLVQGLPGPMFSFSAFASGLSFREGGNIIQIVSALIGALGIFLPGLLLIYFVYPIWEDLKKIKAIKVSLKGINAIAGGLISVSAIILMQKSGFSYDNILVTIFSSLILLFTKLPAPLIVIFTLILGIIL